MTQQDAKRDLSILGIRDMDSSDYLAFCIKQAQDHDPVWSIPFIDTATLHKYEINYYGKFTLNIFIIEDKGQKFFLEFFASLDTDNYHKAANIKLERDRPNEPTLVTAGYNLDNIFLTSHVSNYNNDLNNISSVSPSFVGLAGRIIPNNATPTRILLASDKDLNHDQAKADEYSAKLNSDKYFTTIDSFILPTAILQNLDKIRNKNNWDILAPIVSAEYIEKADTYIVELDFINITMPMAISAQDIFEGAVPQVGSRFHGLGWSQCRIK